jgi:hypothetical protein
MPMTHEAQIFQSLDMIDSQYELTSNLLAAGVNADGMTTFDYTLGRELRIGTSDERKTNRGTEAGVRAAAELCSPDGERPHGDVVGNDSGEHQGPPRIESSPNPMEA